MKKLVLFVAAAVCAGSVFAGLNAGFARVDITPPMGTPISGYYMYRPVEKVLDPVEATCIAFSDGERTALVYSVDNLHICNEVVARAKSAITKAAGVPADAIYIACTHTHTGAATSKGVYFRGLDAEKTAAAVKILDTANAMLVERLAAAGRLAVADMVPVKSVSAARNECKGISFVRLFKMKNGKTQTNPGVENPEIDHPIGSPDETLQLVRVAREGKKEIVVINFQTHPDVIGGNNISADWPGFARRTFEKALGGEVLAAYINGAQGDTNHINVMPTPEQKAAARSRYDHSRKMGYIVAGSALQAYENCVPVEVGKVEYGVKMVKIKTNKAPNAEALEQARKYAALHEAGRASEIPYTGMEYVTVVAEAIRMLDMVNAPDYYELPVSVVTVGKGLAFAGFPGEPFTDLARKLKASSPFTMTIPSCCTSGSWGYFATEAVYAEGGYESRSARLASGVGESLRDALLELLRSCNKANND